MSKQRLVPLPAWTRSQCWESRVFALRVFWARPFLSFLVLSWSNSAGENCKYLWSSWSSRRVQSAVLGSHQRCRGPRGPTLSGNASRTFPNRVFHRHAPSRTQPRHSGLLQKDKCGDAASCKLAAQCRRQVDTTPMVNLAQDDPRPCAAPI